jgi:hypothetical protein
MPAKHVTEQNLTPFSLKLLPQFYKSTPLTTDTTAVTVIL